MVPMHSIESPQNSGVISQKIADKAATVNTDEAKFAEYAEISRVVSMPVIHPMTEAEVIEYSRANILADAFAAGVRLLPKQAEGALSYEMYERGFNPIGVGQGKTLLSLLVAQKGYLRGRKKILLLIPSQVLIQLVEHDLKTARRWIHIPYPIHVLGGRPAEYRRQLANSGKVGLYVLPYSLLSVKDTYDMLAGIAPDLVIMDEAHNLANASSARTRRMFSVLDTLNPQIVAMSGTITQKSVMDYYEIIRRALGQWNPLPNAKALAAMWAQVIDAEATADFRDQERTDQRTVGDDIRQNEQGPMLPLIDWARGFFPAERQQLTSNTAGFRRAYKLRLNTAPGVVVSSDSDIGTSLIIENVPCDDYERHPNWPKCQELIDRIEDLWETPNGDVIDYAVHKWKWLNELTLGFYNQLTWPTKESWAHRKNLSESQSEEALAKALIHHAAGQDYAKELRQWLMDSSKPGIDTPFLVGKDMATNGAKNVGEKLYQAWAAMKGLDFEGRPERDSSAVRVCDYKVVEAAAWATQLPPGEGGLIWYMSQEVGVWCVEKCREFGVNVLHCPAGPSHNAAIIDHANAGKVVVATLNAHGEGKNLQHFHNQYFLQWPRSCKEAEQTIGRTHRTGQKADSLTVYTNITNLFDQMNFAACLNDALYVHQTTGPRQKVIYAAYNPTPKIFPSAVLQERGLQVRMLNREQQQMMSEKFG